MERKRQGFALRKGKTKHFLGGRGGEKGKKISLKRKQKGRERDGAGKTRRGREKAHHTSPNESEKAYRVLRGKKKKKIRYIGGRGETGGGGGKKSQLKRYTTASDSKMKQFLQFRIKKGKKPDKD